MSKSIDVLAKEYAEGLYPLDGEYNRDVITSRSAAKVDFKAGYKQRNDELIDQVTQLLYNLAAFNKLDSRVVGEISAAFKVYADKICADNGIVYFVATP